MSGYSLFRFSAVLGVILGLLLLPAMAFGHGDAPEESEPAVTIDDMTTDSATDTDDETYSQDETYAQNGGDDNDLRLVRVVGLNALWGGAAGGLIGLGVFLLTGFEASPWLIAQFAGGGILIGSTVGLITVLTGAAEPAPTALDERPASVDWVQQHAPDTFEVPVIQGEF